MERRFYGEPEEDDDDENEFNHFVKASSNDIMEVMQMELIEQEINERLLGQAYTLASAEWQWPFRSASYKVKQVRTVFKRLKKIISEEEI